VRPCVGTLRNEESKRTVQTIAGLGEFTEAVDSHLRFEARELGAMGKKDRYTRSGRLDGNVQAVETAMRRLGVSDHDQETIEESTGPRGGSTHGKPGETWKKSNQSHRGPSASTKCQRPLGNPPKSTEGTKTGSVQGMTVPLIERNESARAGRATEKGQSRDTRVTEDSQSPSTLPRAREKCLPAPAEDLPQGRSTPTGGNRGNRVDDRHRTTGRKSTARIRWFQKAILARIPELSLPTPAIALLRLV
jgi:hypothetical protein